MSSLSAARAVARHARVSSLPPVATAAARWFSISVAAPRALLSRQGASITPLVSRGFTSTSAAYSEDPNKDVSWLSKGTVRYAELKPETESPSGDITIIDVREPSETAQGMIPSAVNVPLSNFKSAFTDLDGDFQRDYAFDRPGYDDKIIFYCRSGKRSQQAMEHAQRRGWWNTRNYEGSWLDWVQQEEARGQASKLKEDDD